jgi:hypothetical protein
MLQWNLKLKNENEQKTTKSHMALIKFYHPILGMDQNNG